MQSRLYSEEQTKALAQAISSLTLPDALKVFQLFAAKTFNESGQISLDDFISVFLQIKAAGQAGREPYAAALYAILERDQYSLLQKRLIAYEAEKAQGNIETFMRTDSVLTALMACECKQSIPMLSQEKEKFTLSIRKKKIEPTFFEKYMKPILDELIGIVVENLEAVDSPVWSEELCQKLLPILEKYLFAIFYGDAKEHLPDFIYKNAFEMRKTLEAMYVDQDLSQSKETYMDNYRNDERQVLIKIGGYVNLRFLSGMSKQYILTVIEDQQLQDALLSCLLHVIDFPVQAASNKLRNADEVPVDDKEWKPKTENPKFADWNSLSEQVINQVVVSDGPISYRVESLLNEQAQETHPESLVDVDLHSEASEQPNKAKRTWFDLMRVFLQHVSTRPLINLVESPKSLRKKAKLRRKLSKECEELFLRVWSCMGVASPRFTFNGVDDKDEQFISYPLVVAVMTTMKDEVKDLVRPGEIINWSITNNESETILSHAIRALMDSHIVNRNINRNDSLIAYDRGTLVDRQEIFFIVLYHTLLNASLSNYSEIGLKKLGLDLTATDLIFSIRLTLECARSLQSALLCDPVGSIEDAYYMKPEFVAFFLTYHITDREVKERVCNKIEACFLKPHSEAVEELNEMFLDIAQKLRISMPVDLLKKEKEKEKEKEEEKEEEKEGKGKEKDLQQNREQDDGEKEKERPKPLTLSKKFSTPGTPPALPDFPIQRPPTDVSAPKPPPVQAGSQTTNRTSWSFIPPGTVQRVLGLGVFGQRTVAETPEKKPVDVPKLN